MRKYDLFSKTVSLLFIFISCVKGIVVPKKRSFFDESIPVLKPLNPNHAAEHFKIHKGHNDIPIFMLSHGGHKEEKPKFKVNLLKEEILDKEGGHQKGKKRSTYIVYPISAGDETPERQLHMAYHRENEQLTSETNNQNEEDIDESASESNPNLPNYMNDNYQLERNLIALHGLGDDLSTYDNSNIW